MRYQWNTSFLFTAEDLANNLTLPWPVVKIEEDYLLPGPQCQPSINNKYREGRTQKGGSYMGVSVSIPPIWHYAGIIYSSEQDVQSHP